MKTTLSEARLAASDKSWIDHCREMQRLHNVKAAEMVADGWTIRRRRNGFGPTFTRDGETVVLRRELGSNVWTAEKVESKS